MNDTTNPIADITDRSPMARALALAGVYINAHPGIEVKDIPNLVSTCLSAISQATGAPEAEPVDLKPAVPIRKSVTPDYIICLEDGKRFKSLKRHLNSHYKMTPDEYRAKWNLPDDYPMVAPNYSARRSQLAKDHGLGRKD